MNIIAIVIIIFLMFAGTYMILKLPIFKNSSFIKISTKLFEIIIQK